MASLRSSNKSSPSQRSEEAIDMEGSKPPALAKLFEDDGYLRDYEASIVTRWRKYVEIEKELIKYEGGISTFSKGYEHYGLVQKDNGDIECCEWVPNGERVALVGDFNGWSGETHVCTRDSYNKFHLSLPAIDGKPAIPHNSKVKLIIKTKDGQTLWRMSPWTKYAVQFQHDKDFESFHWHPPQPYQWQNHRPEKPSSVRIYEAHVGISSPELKVTSYRYFADNVLPGVKDLGYTYVELMAIMEHAYYASFGYHVTSFFATSSRYGSPDDFKYLVDKAHGLGLHVILDVIHSHAAKNVNDGLNQFDGTDHCYFHAGTKGSHKLWGSKIFDYTRWEVLRFLLSNLRWYVDEYHVDGFRFDGITAMLYHHRGIKVEFTGQYDEYFNVGINMDAMVYLMLANKMLHELYPFMLTIAEDVSGMPTLCRPVEEGGFGFDYRMAMAIPDMWIKLLKETKDEDWNMGTIWWTMTNRRYHEKVVAYAECHDQALVGDKSLAFWMMDAEMYCNMSVFVAQTAVIDRGLALHKMIRLITMGLGGDAYLNFIGNEFGHPEWLDFPREGNNSSYHYARRQMNLAHDPLLRYRFLFAFDRDMQRLESEHPFLNSGPAYVSCRHDGDMVIAFDRGGLIFIFNFHPNQSYTNYYIGAPNPGKYRIALNSDSKVYDGHGRVEDGSVYFTSPEGKDRKADKREHRVSVYIPCRSALVLSRED